MRDRSRGAAFIDISDQFLALMEGRSGDPPPVGPAALVCFAAAALLIERWRARELLNRRVAGIAVTPEAT